MLKKILAAPLLQIAFLTLLILTGMVTSRGPWHAVEERNFDFWSARRHLPADQPIAIVAIDDQSIRRFGDWPWPRTQIADLVNLLSDNGAAAVGLCLLYTQPDRSTGAAAIRQVKTRLTDPQWTGDRPTTAQVIDILDDTAAGLDQDAALIDAVRRARNASLPFYVTMEPTEGDLNAAPSGMVIVNSLNPRVLPAADTGRPWEVARAMGAVMAGPALGSRVLEPFEALSGKAGALGHLNMVEDPDGRVRSLPLLIDCEGRLLPAMALQMALKQKGVRLADLSIQSDMLGQPRLHAADLDLVTDGAYRMLLQVDREWTKQRLFSFSEIIGGEIDPAVFRDQIVLIGITAHPLARAFRVGWNGQSSDVEIMANALAGILAGKMITRPSWARVLEIGVLFYFAVFLALVIPRGTLRIGMTILFIFLVTWYAAGVGLMLAYGYKIDVMGPIVLAVAGFLLLQFTLTSRRLQLEKRNTLKTLGLTYQGQGMLDMAHEKFMQMPVQDRTAKHLLFNLALDFERKRMFNKALDIYRHIRSAGAYKDVDKRITRFADLDSTLAAGSPAEKQLVAEGGGTKPTFGRYEILREIGRGGMGTVYLARDPKINREVAIKTLSYSQVEPAELSEVKTRFFREAEAAGNLSHPNIVSIYDVGEEHDMAYIAMELLKGETLAWTCIKDRLLPVQRVLAIMADVASALEYAHQRGVIHRDIKPANIMMLEEGRIKVTDFSIARVVDASQTRTGVVMGTPNYMSPEQVTGHGLDGRSDLFSLGIVFYEMLTGIKPFNGDSISGIMYAITHRAHKPLASVADGIPHCVKRVVNKLLAKPKNKRFESAANAGKAIHDCLDRIG